MSDHRNWDLIIKPQSGWFDLNLRDVWRYRDLILLFVKRDIVTFYKQTILGPLWFIIQPLFNTIVFTVIFGRIAKIPTDGIPPFLFYLSGTVVWGYFAQCLNETSKTFRANASIFGKVYFPRLIVPISVVISSIVQFLIQFSIFLGFFFYFQAQGSHVEPNALIWVLPLILVQMACLGFGCGILISSLTTKYRDLSFAIGFGVQLWMYLTPIVYPLSQVPEKYRLLYAVNPMVAIVESFRLAFLGVGVVEQSQVLMGISTTLLLCCLGVFMFSRVERTFMDTI